MSGERLKPELVADEQFMVNLDTSEPEDYMRDSDVNPTDLMFDWIAATVRPRQKGAKALERQFLELVEPDAVYYRKKYAQVVTAEDIFLLLHEALDEEYVNYEGDDKAR